MCAPRRADRREPALRALPHGALLLVAVPGGALGLGRTQVELRGVAPEKPGTENSLTSN